MSRDSFTLTGTLKITSESQPRAMTQISYNLGSARVEHRLHIPNARSRSIKIKAKTKAGSVSQRDAVFAAAERLGKIGATDVVVQRLGKLGATRVVVVPKIRLPCQSTSKRKVRAGG